ncbi:unnamed protein product [Bursaphelenchus xylophilus]|uniref:(pine wood nematode) hypothetical protein n=1 Tax=Bursaphelenchus xylophilus TaxID=6326 RepID=A0A1I7SU70_BURXY|nr:unnamed protein product [Bursaphelenchus xylophilus]CAG9107493.1 unnamed protein product [Bursaphelenchus xylophilus]
MNIFTLLVFLAILHLVWSCPDFCTCREERSIKCQNLNTIQFKSVNDYFKSHNSSRLINLSLINCSIFDVNSIPPHVFNGLLYLDLSYNHLNDFNFNSNNLMPLLVILKLTGNHLISVQRSFFASVPNIEEIYLNYNSIFVIDWEAFRLYKLKKLFLDHNHLLAINEHILRFIPNLETLDLSFNQLVSVQSSSFFAARKLSTLDLSHNRLQRIDYDSFVPLHQLQQLDLSSNNLSVVPSGLGQFMGLRSLNFSENPLTIIHSGDFSLPMLQVLSITDCPFLKLIEVNSFLEMPNLQTLIIRNNPLLSYVSPRALVNSTSIFELDLRNNSLHSIFFPDITPSKIWLSGNPLDCECMFSNLETLDERLRDKQDLKCITGTGKSCPTQSLTPLGDQLEAVVGQQIAIYCQGRMENDRISWSYNQYPRNPVDGHHLRALHALSMQPIDQLETAHNDRTRQIKGEQLVIEAVIQEDEQDYICKLERENRTVSEKKIHLTVHKPNIKLFPIDVGSHYVALGWNSSLNIKWTVNIRLMLAVKDNNNSTLRVIQLNVLNPWYGYNVIRLRPEQNYTFCLFYEFIYNYPGVIYETCTKVRTLPSINFWSSLHPSTIIIITGISFTLFIMLCFRGFYIRFYIWHQTKQRARMNQSISGQSFLSHSVSRSETTIMDRSLHIENSNAMRMSRIESSHTEDTEVSLLDSA